MSVIFGITGILLPGNFASLLYSIMIYSQNDACQPDEDR